MHVSTYLLIVLIFDSVCMLGKQNITNTHIHIHIPADRFDVWQCVHLWGEKSRSSDETRMRTLEASWYMSLSLTYMCMYVFEFDLYVYVHVFEFDLYASVRVGIT